MEANCKRVIETIAPQQESHDVTEPIGPLSLHYEGISQLLKTQRPYIQYAFEKVLFTNESQEIIKQYLRFNLNENHDDDESDCINADDKNDDDQDAHSSIDGDAEGSDEQDSQNSDNINNEIIHNFSKTLQHFINEKQMFVKFLLQYFTVYIHNVPLPLFFVTFITNKELAFSSVGEPLHDHGHIFA